MSIEQNSANTNGGDGQPTFALPDLRGRVPVGTAKLARCKSYYLFREKGKQMQQLKTESAVDVSAGG